MTRNELNLCIYTNVKLESLFVSIERLISGTIDSDWKVLFKETHKVVQISCIVSARF